MEKKVVEEVKCLHCKYLDFYFKKKRNSPNNKHYHCVHLCSFNKVPEYCKYYIYEERKEQK